METNQKLLFTVSLTKREAKRLLFLFPVKGEHKPFAGRHQTRYGIDAQSWEDVQGQVKVKHFEKTAFGHTIFKTASTNGFSAQLKWSNACHKIGPDHIVVIQLFKMVDKHAWIFRVAPHKAGKTWEEGSTKPTTIGIESESEGLDITLMPRSIRLTFANTNKAREKKFNFLLSDISEGQKKCMSEDLWRFDTVVTVDETNSENPIWTAVKHVRPVHSEYFNDEVIELDETIIADENSPFVHDPAIVDLDA